MGGEEDPTAALPGLVVVVSPLLKSPLPGLVPPAARPRGRSTPNEVVALTLPVAGGAPPLAFAFGATLPGPAPATDWPDGPTVAVLPPCMLLEKADPLPTFAFGATPRRLMPDGLMVLPLWPPLERGGPPPT